MRTLHLPAEPGVFRALEAGEELLLTGDALTMRDAGLNRLLGLADRGLEPPFDLEGQLVFHAGPTPAGGGRPAAAIGPTTAARMDALLPLLMEMKIAAVLGKGPRSEEARGVHGMFGVPYLVAVGGVGALLASRVEKMEPVAWADLGPEAVLRVSMRDFPVVVAIDARGRDYLREQYSRYRDESGRM